jgi:hypothetical protein
MELEVLLAASEGKILEFKRDLSSPEGALRAVVRTRQMNRPEGWKPVMSTS